MKIIVAPDSFKECLDAFAVAEAIAAGVRRGASQAVEVACYPLADGGEGLLEVLRHALGGEMRHCSVTGPLGAPVAARFGLFDQGRTAVIETAQACGLHLVPREFRNPCVTTTRGVGELMQHALDADVSRMIIGVGGSATNDGGAGMAQALGVSLTDSYGQELPSGGLALQRLAHINGAALDPRLKTVDIEVACDVSNLLYGEQGASFIYGPQKGATSDDVQRLDAALRRYAAVAVEDLGFDMQCLRGGGAAGGLASGLAIFAGARLRTGIEVVIDAYGDLEDSIREAHLVITGEGAVDGQTMQGKVVAGVAALAYRSQTPVLVFAGKVGAQLEPLYASGVTAIFPIAAGPTPLEEALRDAPRHLERTAANAIRYMEAAIVRSAILGDKDGEQSP